MLLPIACVNACVLDGVSAVDHHSVADVDANMRSTGRIIGSLEEDQITGLGICRRYRSADVADCPHKSANVPTNTTVIENPRYKTGAVKEVAGELPPHT